jgi:hypothetical protein
MPGISLFASPTCEDLRLAERVDGLSLKSVARTAGIVAFCDVTLAVPVSWTTTKLDDIDLLVGEGTVT